MNIAYILNATIPEGGATKSFLVMLKRLMQLGVSPLVVVPDREGIYQTLVDMGVPVLATTFRMNSWSHCDTLKDWLLFLPRMVAKIIANDRAAKILTRVFRERGIDIVHTNVGPVSVGFRAARRLGLPHVYHLREYGKKDFSILYFPSETSFYRQLNAPHSYNICITNDIQLYHRQNDRPSSRVIYNGIRVAMDKMPAAAPVKDYFLFAGRIQPAKGVDTLLEAYARYCEKTISQHPTPNTQHPIPLRLAGGTTDSVYMKKLENFVKTHGLGQNVTFLGKRSDMDELMQHARSIVIPSPNEGFGRCMPEAMFQGCLAIGHNTAGTKEQFDNGLRVTGKEIGLRYETTEELASLLAEVSSRPADYYRPYTERAFNVVNQLYTQESNAQQVYTFYQEILKENK